MLIEGLIWLDEIIEKLIWKHHVQQSEVGEILSNKPHFRFVEKGHRRGEDVYAVLGQTIGDVISLFSLCIKKDKHMLILSA